jgi:hypothetical protein
METLARAAPDASSTSAVQAMRKERILPLASRPDPALAVPRHHYARNPHLVPVA